METTSEIDRHLTANMNLSKKDIMIGNFLGGLAWGLGTVVGATVVITIVGAVLNYMGVLPAIGSLFGQLGALQEVTKQSLPQQIPNLPR